MYSCYLCAFIRYYFFIRSLSFKEQKEGKSKGEKNEEKNPILSDQEQNQLVKSLAEQFIKEMHTATTADEETKRLAPLETRFLVKKDSQMLLVVRRLKMN